MEVWTIWNATYWLSGYVKLITAVASVATAIVLPPLVPQTLTMVRDAKLSGERGAQLREINEQLERELSERRRAEQALVEMQERFQGIYESSKDGITFTDFDGLLLDVNAAYARLTGYTKDEMLGNKNYQELTPPEYHEHEARHIAETIRTGEASEFEKEYVRKDARACGARY